MNKLKLILLSTLVTFNCSAGERDELRSYVEKLPEGFLFSLEGSKPTRKYMPGLGLKGGGPVAGYIAYGATKAFLYGGALFGAGAAVAATGGAAGTALAGVSGGASTAAGMVAAASTLTASAGVTAAAGTATTVVAGAAL